MACEINLGLLPDLSGILPFDKQKLDICELVSAGGAFANPVGDAINVGVGSINSSITTIDTELAQFGTDVTQLTTWEGSPPAGWNASDITDVKNATTAKETCANDRKTSSTALKAKLDTNFQQHTDILSGVNLTPSGGVANVFARSGLEDSINVTRKQFNTPVVSETANMFGSIYNGQDKLSEIKVETDKLPVGSVIALDIQNRITGGTAAADKAQLISDISALTCQDDVALNNFANDIQGLIDGDEATYTSLANELLGCIGALSVDGWVSNPFKLQLLQCIGSAALKALTFI